MTRCLLDPIIYTARCYGQEVDDDINPHNSSLGEFECVATITIMHDTAFISAMHGEFTRMSYIGIRHELRKKGINRVIWERHKNGETVLEERIIN